MLDSSSNPAAFTLLGLSFKLAGYGGVDWRIPSRTLAGGVELGHAAVGDAEGIESGDVGEGGAAAVRGVVQAAFVAACDLG
jgi:hypothetical protein